MPNAEIDIGGVLGSRRGVVGNQGPTMAFMPIGASNGRNTNSAVRRCIFFFMRHITEYFTILMLIYISSKYYF